jgi:hypothetical protein
MRIGEESGAMRTEYRVRRWVCLVVGRPHHSLGRKREWGLGRKTEWEAMRLEKEEAWTLRAGLLPSEKS